MNRPKRTWAETEPLIVGTSVAIKAIHALIAKVAASRATVLLVGETGTGKELVAQAIHRLSPRKNERFVAVNCSALAETLLESELFGHEKGAFTGAIRARPGRFELANGGTLFLDEVGDLSPAIQVKLLRVLQEGEFERVGGEQSLRVDTRIVCATNRDLERAVREGRFRQDLYYRIDVVRINIPPLRERRQDIPQLANYFLRRFSQEARSKAKKVKRISPEATRILVNYPWPGNVRELENAIERAALLSDGPSLRPSAFTSLTDQDPEIIRRITVERIRSLVTNITPLGKVLDAVDDAKRLEVRSVLQRVRGDVDAAARMLGLTPREVRAPTRKRS